MDTLTNRTVCLRCVLHLSVSPVIVYLLNTVYCTKKPPTFSLSQVNPRDGRIIALSGLDAGRYSLNATVTDGRFSVSVPVSVYVEWASASMLRHAVTVRFERVSPHDFVSSHLTAVRRVIADAMGTGSSDTLHVLSVQPVETTGQLDLLLAVEAPGGGSFLAAALVSQKLSAARRRLEQVLRVSAVLDKNCSGLECGEARCEQTITLDTHALLTYTTSTSSFVSPRFQRSARCVCTGESQKWMATDTMPCKSIHSLPGQVIKHKMPTLLFFTVGMVVTG